MAVEARVRKAPASLPPGSVKGKPPVSVSGAHGFRFRALGGDVLLTPYAVLRRADGSCREAYAVFLRREGGELIPVASAERRPLLTLLLGAEGGGGLAGVEVGVDVYRAEEVKDEAVVLEVNVDSAPAAERPCRVTARVWGALGREREEVRRLLPQLVGVCGARECRLEIEWEGDWELLALAEGGRREGVAIRVPSGASCLLLPSLFDVFLTFLLAREEGHPHQPWMWVEPSTTAAVDFISGPVYIDVFKVPAGPYAIVTFNHRTGKVLVPIINAAPEEVKGLADTIDWLLNSYYGWDVKRKRIEAAIREAIG